MKLRSFMADVADRVQEFPKEAVRLRRAGGRMGLPSEFMGGSAVALKAALAIVGLPAELAADMDDALSAIRTGFERVGHKPNF
jgi:hypothetical protein